MRAMLPRSTCCRRAVAAMFVVTALVVLIPLMDSMGSAYSLAARQAPGRVFASDAGLIINTIKPDKTADFEMVMGKLKEALAKSEDPTRRQQAAGWKVFRSAEAGPNNSVLYVFVMDPTVKEADYTIATILNEAFPTEVQDLYVKFSEAYVSGQSLLNLNLVQAFND